MFAKSFYFSFGDKKLKKKDTTNIQFYYKHHREVWGGGMKNTSIHIFPHLR